MDASPDSATLAKLPHPQGVNYSISLSFNFQSCRAGGNDEFIIYIYIYVIYDI